KMSYDNLVISCGNTANLGLVPGMDDHAFALKTVGDALALQAHVMEQMERAEVCEDEACKRWYLSFIVVGGGFSGVEVAGEINDLVRKSRKFFQTIKQSDISVTIVHSRDSILPEVSPSLREFAKKEMERNGVRILLNSVAAAATPEGITLTDGTYLTGGTIVCTIGTTVLPVIQRLDVPKKNGRLITEADMSLPGYPNTWAIGDCAAITNAIDGSLCPPIGQFAEREGTQVAKNIAARINGQPTKPFSYKQMGSLCSIGGHSAVAEVMGFRISGFIAWFLWRGVYLMKLPSFAQQAKVGLEWACDLIFPRTLAHMKADRSRRVGRAYYESGDFVFHEGDPATEFYVIQAGQVEVVKGAVNDAPGEVLAVLGPGDFFGEGALLDSRARNASVRARTNLEVVVLGRNVFSQISSALTPLKDAVADAMKRRTNIWKSLPEAYELLEAIPLDALVEPLPAEPLRPDDLLETAIDVINKHRLDFCCVADSENRLLGILSRSDLLHAIELAVMDSSKEITVRDIMVPDPITITIDDNPSLAMSTMREHGLKKLPVVDTNGSKVIKGYIRVENILNHLLKLWGTGELLVATSHSGNPVH
ncbi:MAG TPA: FAD-dependent oxidoreductase, partial [Candidatus Obscuribacterales bacterium]